MPVVESWKKFGTVLFWLYMVGLFPLEIYARLSGKELPYDEQPMCMFFVAVYFGTSKVCKFIGKRR